MKFLKWTMLTVVVGLSIYIICGLVVWGYFGVWERYKYYAFYKNGDAIYRLQGWRFSKLQQKFPKIIDGLETIYIPLLRVSAFLNATILTEEEKIAADKIIGGYDNTSRCMFGYTYFSRPWIIRINRINMNIDG